MPHSQYIPGQEPPALIDRVLAHSFVVTVGLAGFFLSVLLLLSLHPEIVVSRALEGVHPLVITTLAAALAVGSTLLYRGAVFGKCAWSKLDAMRVEMSGCIASSLAWFAFSLSVLFSGNPYGVITIVVTAGVGWGFCFHATALALSSRRVRLRLEAEDALRKG